MMNRDLLSAVNSLYAKYRNWPQTGQAIALIAYGRGEIDSLAQRHVNRYMALANKVYHEKVSDSPTLCRALGLPPLAVPVAPCHDCGKVHERLRTCDHKRQTAQPSDKLRRAAWLTASEARRLDTQRERVGVAVADILLEWVDRMEINDGRKTGS